MKISLLVILAVAGIYLNRSYAHIYSAIDAAGLKSPDTAHAYILGEDASKKSITYVAVGDSLTAGVGVSDYHQSFPFLIAKRIASEGNMVVLKDRAVPGFKTEDIRNNLLNSVIQDQPDIVTVLAGVNDIHGNVSKKEFRKNYEMLLQRLTQETEATVYTLSIPYLGGPRLILPPYNFYFDWRTHEFNEVIKELAGKYDVPYIELPVPTEYASDSFHPSAQGYAAWASIIHE